MKSHRWMHRKDWDTVKQNRSHVSLRGMHNAMATHTQGRQTQQPGTCYEGVLGQLERKLEMEDIGGRR